MGNFKMFSLRYFGSRAQYFVTERMIGWRSFGNIEFMQGYFTAASSVPRIDTSTQETNSEPAQETNNAPAQEKIKAPCQAADKLHSTGSQVEVDFSNTEIPEWHNNPNPNAKFDELEPGHEVPEVFREHRHSYSAKPSDIGAYRRQIMYRCGHIGTKELEIVLRDWLALNAHNMTYEELE